MPFEMELLIRITICYIDFFSHHKDRYKKRGCETQPLLKLIHNVI